MTAQEKPNIIFIDDDPRILRSLNTIFRASHNVYITEDPDDFLDKVRNIPMDVIVCDQKMPQISGTELLSQVRRIAPDAIRILLTGYAERDDVLDAINEGEIYRYITKPWDSDDLLRTIGDATNIARALREVRGQYDGENAPVQAGCGVMVMFENEKIFEKFRYVFQRHYTPYWAKDLDSAMEILLERDIGIILSDVHFCGQDVVSAMNVLKTYFPQIMSIVVTQTQDSDALIDLINYGQVYRCLVRPVSTRLLGENLRGAAMRHALLRDHPEEQARHQVETLQSEDEDGKVKELMENIRKRQEERVNQDAAFDEEAAEAAEVEMDFTEFDDETQIFELELELEDDAKAASGSGVVAAQEGNAPELALAPEDEADLEIQEPEYHEIHFDEKDLDVLDDDSVEIIDAGYVENKTGQ